MWMKFVRTACPDVRSIQCLASTTGIAKELSSVSRIEVCGGMPPSLVRGERRIDVVELPPDPVKRLRFGQEESSSHRLFEVTRIDISGLLTLTSPNRYDVLQAFARKKLINVHTVVANECAPSLLILLISTFRHLGNKCRFSFHRSFPPWRVAELRGLDCVLGGMNDDDVDSIHLE